METKSTEIQSCRGTKSVLVVGAGPVGLAAALELARQGWSVRVFEKLQVRSELSKAIGINPRTLDLLEASGVTTRLLAEGVRFKGVRVYGESQCLFSILFEWLEHPRRFLLGLPQARTEGVLEQRLTELGIEVERGRALLDFEQNESEVRARVSSTDGNDEWVTGQYLIGADGAHSAVRKTLGIAFPGQTSADDWSLADVALETELDPAFAHSFSLPDRMVFLICFHPGLWRAASNLPNVLDHLPEGVALGAVHWRSDFRVSFRQAERYHEGRVFLCGDAAHVHSPIGARGMNMGIEDAVLLARLIVGGRIEEYGSIRHRATGAAMSMVRVQTWLATRRAWIPNLLRNHLLPVVLKIPFVQRQLVKRMAGLGDADLS